MEEEKEVKDMTQFDDELVEKVAEAIHNSFSQDLLEEYKPIWRKRAEDVISIIAPRYEKQIAELKTDRDKAESLAMKHAARVMQLEIENAELKAQITKQSEMLKVARDGLDKLARLGNAPYLGNSDGNIIAQEILAVINQEVEI